MNEDLLKYSDDPEAWRRCAEAVADDLRLLDMDGARAKTSEILPERDAEMQRNQALQPLRDMLQKIANQRWPATRRHYTLGRIDADVLALACENRLLNWQEAFNAKASFGEAKDLETLHDAAVKAGAAPNLNQALQQAAKPALLIRGLRFEGNLETVEQLFKMGADPNYENNGQLFMSVVDEGRADIGRVFAKYGQDGTLSLDNWVKWARNNRKLKLYADLRKIQWEYGRFTVLDNDTLLEKKELPDNEGNLKILFNFASRRVTEILELTNTNPRPTVVKEYSFEDYGERALEKAREKLVEMGASPAGVEIPLRGKAVVARPAGLGLPGKKASPGA